LTNHKRAISLVSQSNSQTTEYLSKYQIVLDYFKQSKTFSDSAILIASYCFYL